MNVAVQPARQRRAKETDHREREEVNSAQTREKRSAVDERDDPKNRQHDSENEPDPNAEFYEDAKQVETEQKNQSASNGGKRRAVLAKKSADGTGGRAEGNEDGRESEDESERRSEQSRARRLTLAQLLHADAGKHRDVSGHERQNARRQEGNESREKGPS